jgi:hypothetical protein
MAANSGVTSAKILPRVRRKDAHTGLQARHRSARLGLLDRPGEYLGIPPRVKDAGATAKHLHLVPEAGQQFCEFRVRTVEFDEQQRADRS